MPPVSTLVVNVLANIQGLQKSLSQGQIALKNFGVGATKVGSKMTMGLTLPIAMAGIATAKMAMDFESQMANIFTLMDEATIHSRNWKEEVLDLSKKVPQSTDVLSKGLYDIISAGIDAGSAMDVLGVASVAATAGLSDTAVAVKAITSVLNAYSLSADEAEDVSDILFTTVKYGITTFPELAGAIGKVIGTASAANIPFEQVGAALATITKAGINTREAVVGLNQTILTFIKPTKEAKALAEELGLEFSATALATQGLGETMFKLVDAIGVSTDGLEEMEKAGMEETEIMYAMAEAIGMSVEKFAIMFPNVRALKGALALARNEGDDFNKMLEAQADRIGATDAAFSKIAETTTFKFDLALSSLKAAAIEIGTNLLPTLGKLFDRVGELADRFGALDEDTQDMIIAYAELAAIIGPLLWGMGKLITIGVSLRATYVSLATAIGAGGVAGAMASAIPIVGQLAGALVILGIQTAQNQKVIGEYPDLFNKIKEAGDEWTYGQLTNTEKIREAIRMLGVYQKNYSLDVSGQKEKLIQMYIDEKISVEQLESSLDKLKDEVRMFGSGELEEFSIGWKNLGHHLGVFGDEVDTSETRLKSMSLAIMDYRYANQDLITTLQTLESEHSIGLITSEEYAKGLQTLYDSNGEYKGSIVELYHEIGVFTDEQYEAATAAQNIATAVGQSDEAFGVAQISLNELINGYMNGTISIEEFNTGVANQTTAVNGAEQAIKSLYSSIFDFSIAEDTLEQSVLNTKSAIDEYTKSLSVNGPESDKTKGLQSDMVREFDGLFNSIGAVIAKQPDYIKSNDEVRISLLDMLASLREMGGVTDEEWTRAVSLIGAKKSDIDTLLTGLGKNYSEGTKEALLDFRENTDYEWQEVFGIVKKYAGDGGEIGQRMAEMGFSYDAMIENNLANFREMTGTEWEEALRLIGLNEEEIEGVLDELGIAIEEVPEAHNTEFSISGVDSVSTGVSFINGLIGSVPSSKIITFRYKTEGSPPQFKEGGVIPEMRVATAQAGMITPPYGETMIMAHPNEVMLNPRQQANLLFKMANTGGEGGGIINNNYITIEKANIRGENDIEILAEQISEKIFEKQDDSLRGVGDK